MRAVVQRVESASVFVNGKVEGEIGNGLLIFLGISTDDSEEDISYITSKILNLRIFNDQDGKMNLSILDSRGDLLVVSQFTLYGDCRRGNRPSYSKAADSELAESIYQKFLKNLRNSGLKVEEGVFGAFMSVNLTNSGPVTILVDSSKQF